MGWFRKGISGHISGTTGAVTGGNKKGIVSLFIPEPYIIFLNNSSAFQYAGNNECPITRFLLSFLSSKLHV
jgi:hypothetical protein